MKQKLWAKIFAFLALFWIIIWIVGTGVLFLLQSWWTYQVETPPLTQEEIDQLIEEAGLEGNIDWDTSIEDDSIVEIVTESEDSDLEVESVSWTVSQ